MEHKLLRPADLVLLLVAAAAAAALLFWQSAQAQGNCVAVIEENGVELERVDLSSLTEATEIDLGGDYSVVLLAEPGKICAGNGMRALSSGQTAWRASYFTPLSSRASAGRPLLDGRLCPRSLSFC